MFEITEDEASELKTPPDHDSPHIASEPRRARLDADRETPKTGSNHSRSVHESVSNTGLILWGRLIPLDESRWPELTLADRQGDPQAPKPPGYIVGRDSECGESDRPLS